MDYSLRNRKLNRSRQKARRRNHLLSVGDWKAYLYETKDWAAEKAQHYLATWKSYRWNFWHSLIFEQKCYLVATVAIFAVWFSDLTNTNALSYVPLLIAMVGLVSEIWPRFLKTWDSLFGRTIILLFYALIANFALASAGGLVNDLTGVSAEQLPYSHNIALIVSLPAWILYSSTLALLIIQLVSPLYLIFLLLLKILGLSGFWHPKNYRFVITTFIARFIWAMALLICLFLASVYSGFINQTTPFLGPIYSGFTEGNDNIGITIEDDGSIKPIENKVQKSPEEAEEHSAKFVERSEKALQTQMTILASFVYNYEADERSRCEVPKGSRVIELNDYEILTITKDLEQRVGYSFAVIPCSSPGINRALSLPDSSQPSAQ